MSEYKIKYFDSHTHPNFKAYEEDLDIVMERTLINGVGFVVAGSKATTSESAVRLAEKYADLPIFAAVGLHPIHTAPSFHDDDEDGVADNSGEKFDESFYGNLLKSKKVIAIGECGLDYFHLPDDEKDAEHRKKIQMEEFMHQIEFAKKNKKPLVIHCRDAYKDLAEILSKFPPSSDNSHYIIHCFCGTVSEADMFMEMNCFFTFGGAITYAPKKGGADYAETIKHVPFNRILSETDAPYLAPIPYRGKRNEPVFMSETVKKMAEIRGVSLEEMRVQILKNSEEAFHINLS